MKAKLLLIFSLSFYLFSCNGQNTHIPAAITSAAPVKINRFDKELLKLVETNDSTQQTGLVREYPQMLDILGKGILNMKSPAMPGFFDKLVNYYSEPTLKGLYTDAVRQYEDVSQIEQALGNGFAWLKTCFPSMQIPAIYMHVSGFNQNVLVGDSLLSISIDKYLGEGYPLYQDFFYDFQRRLMTPEHIVPDYLAGWRMIYEGKIKYLIHQAFPELAPEALMGYTETSYNWCKENESNLWKAIIERKHLYTPDQMTTGKYFDNVPGTFLASDAPGNLGSWLGWQIIDKYMRETNSTPEA
ncbi:MAG: gliding motility protein GldB, partial [Bacteroidales bacterium 55_9]